MPPSPRPLEDAVGPLPAAPLCVGLSGGLDSTVLLHLLASLPAARERGLRALHVHHGLQQQADDWAAHCQATCNVLDVPLVVRRVAVGRNHGLGVEGAARQARREAFAHVLRDGEVLALAHHLDDQAETFLLRALRASGPDGLAAMSAWRPFARGHLWRPLLGLPRAALEQHAHLHDLRWIDDPSNRDASYDRNFLRSRVLPLLRERWPQASASLARSAALCGDAAALLADGDAQALQACAVAPAPAPTGEPSQAGPLATVLACDTLSALPPTRRARVLRHWINGLGLPPLPAAGVARIEAELLPARTDAAAMFEWAGASVRAWRGCLHAGWMQAPLPAGWSARWDGLAPLRLPNGDKLELTTRDRDEEPGSMPPHPRTPPFSPPLIVHPRRGGERITLPGRRHSHMLKQVLQDLGIPPWERKRLPLLSSENGELLAAGDRVVSAALQDWLDRHGRALAWHRERAAPAAQGSGHLPR